MKWDTYKPAKHELFATKDVLEAMQYVDEILGPLSKSDQRTAYIAAYVMYNSVIEHYETKMICTKRGDGDDR